MIDIQGKLQRAVERSQHRGYAEQIIRRFCAPTALQPSDADAIILDYISYKFMLEREQLQITDDLIDLAKRSVSQAIKTREIKWDQKDFHGTTESMTKKILLVTSIEKNLDIKIDKKAYMQLNTAQDLRNIVCSLLADKAM